MPTKSAEMMLKLSEEDRSRIDRLCESLEELRKALTCKACRGRGVIHCTFFGYIGCPACKGRGY